MSTATIKSLQNAITQKPPFINGTMTFPSIQQNLFYKSLDGINASWVNLANATPEQLESLIQACEPATFGRDKKDVLDESYHKAWKMDKGNFATQLDLTALRLIDRIQKNLLCDYENAKPIIAELYKLNVYDKDSFSSRTKTPLAANPCSVHLSSFFLLFTKVKPLSYATAIKNGPLTRLKYYRALKTILPLPTLHSTTTSDTKSRLSKSGHRITLTYNLYFDTESSSDSATAGLGSKFKEALIDALEDDTFLPEGGRLGFGLNSRYPVDSVTKLVAVSGRLRGNDAVIKNVCDELGLATSINAVYISDEYGNKKTKVLTTSIVDYMDMEMAEELGLHLVQHQDGKIVDDPEFDREVLDEWEDADSEGLTLTDHIVEVLWVTPLTTASSFTTTYVAGVAYDAHLEHAHGDLCLIANVGKAGDRPLPRKRKRSKQDS